MTHYRSTMRSAAKLALTMNDHFSGIEIVSGWLQSVDEKSLPIIAVRLPSERKHGQLRGSSDRTSEIIVSLRRQGGEGIEDDLDADSVEIECAIIDAMLTHGFGVALVETSFDIDGQGSKRIGSLDMKFEITAQVVDPIHKF